MKRLALLLALACLTGCKTWDWIEDEVTDAVEDWEAEDNQTPPHQPSFPDPPYVPDPQPDPPALTTSDEIDLSAAMGG